jgi:hypothetical protein
MLGAGKRSPCWEAGHVFKRCFVSRFSGGLLIALAACSGRKETLNGTPPATEGGGGGEAGAETSGSGASDSLGEAGNPSASTGGTAATGGTDSGGTGGTSEGGGTSSGGTGGTSSTAKFCQLGDFDTDLSDDALTCEPWSICPPGTYVLESGSYTRDQACEPCPSEQFSEGENAASCKKARKCTFGQELEMWPTPTTDRVCVNAETFPPLEWEDAETGSLVVTQRGVYLLARSFEAADEVVIVRYSLTGDTHEPWIVLGENDDVIDIGDMTHLGNDIYVTGVGVEAPSEEESDVPSGFVKKFDPESGLVWSTPLGDGDEVFETTRLSTHDGKLFVVGVLREVPEAPTGTVLYVLDTDGNLESTMSLAPGGGEPDSFDFTMTSDGDVFVTVSEFNPNGSPLVVRRFEDTGASIFGFHLPYGASFFPSVTAGNIDDIYAVVGETWTDPPGSAEFPRWQYVLYHMGIAGWASIPVEHELGDRVSAFAPSDGGFVMVGRDKKRSPLLISINHQAQIQSRTVVEGLLIDPEGQNGPDFVSGITGIQQAANGTVFVGGFAPHVGIFVTPWPE